MNQTIQIEKPIQCGDCDFATVDGEEMYSHFVHKHDIVWSYMQYRLSWAVGDRNTYHWMHSHTRTLDAEGLRKCEECNKPYIAYNHRDHCEDCLKIPKVQQYLKYSHNKAGYSEGDDSLYYRKRIKCDRCDQVLDSYENQMKHGELLEIDGSLQYYCEIPQ